ncbi:hypothetical protein A0H81_01633 [Grifola frondosa]|uniref:Uncharacterized protein n=1 Tax=Grifola frondosa TaxID=5627 RepID=A0A1C7MNF4_GRIFR|nr:hypothetical protein A0H81_01633 [Grifola frondosa]
MSASIWTAAVFESGGKDEAINKEPVLHRKNLVSPAARAKWPIKFQRWTRIQGLLVLGTPEIVSGPVVGRVFDPRPFKSMTKTRGFTANLPQTPANTGHGQYQYWALPRSSTLKSGCFSMGIFNQSSAKSGTTRYVLLMSFLDSPEVISSMQDVPGL